ncbi:hypothetical protein [Cucumibacter marinus]|uniref:hypothetical protein n=1 Tax=Cucumibacter marinus TaxID=1121252 RepID=UPI000418ECB8|nr:hypothetical protein [Cucumibacter marinus]
MPHANNQESFVVEAPEFLPGPPARIAFSFRLAGHRFTETLSIADSVSLPAASNAFNRVMDLTAAVLGVSYFKLKAPEHIDLSALDLPHSVEPFLLDVYENGLGEFYARNNLNRFGRIRITGLTRDTTPIEPPSLARRHLLLIGGGKDSLASAGILERAGATYTPFAVNPKGPILGSFDRLMGTPLSVRRMLDSQMLRLRTEPGFYDGHVPSTAINTMIAALMALCTGHDRVVLSNERSASEGNVEHDGRVANHQHSKSLAFENLIRQTLADATGGALEAFSLLRPFSEARIAALFARDTRFDTVFSSCNRNFTIAPHDGPLWCGECPKCQFVGLVLATAMPPERLIGIMATNVLDRPDLTEAFRQLSGLSGHKPWECVGEIREAGACLWRLSTDANWKDAHTVSTLRPELESFYGADTLTSEWQDLMAPAADHNIPSDLIKDLRDHAA